MKISTIHPVIAGASFLLGCLFMFSQGTVVWGATSPLATSTPPFTLSFTINNSAKTLSVSSLSTLTLSWSALGAKNCEGDWVNYKLRSTGMQTKVATKSQNFRITCVSRAGVSKTASVNVSVRGASGGSAPTTVKRPVESNEKDRKDRGGGQNGVKPTSSSSVLAPSASQNLVSLRVFSPNGDEVWKQGEVRDITWLVDEVPLTRTGFTVDLIDDRGTSYALPTSTVVSLARSYTWRIPSTFPHGRYRARVKIPGQTSSDMSDTYFMVTKVFPGLTRTLACGSLGDVNSDGIISTADMEQIKVFSATPSIMTPADFKRADVNVNGIITASDVVELDQYLTETRKAFSGCAGAEVSVSLRASVTTIPQNGSVTLSWTSNGGRCLFEDAYFPPNGSITKLVLSSATSTTYTVQCFGEGSSKSASGSVVVAVEPMNRAPFTPLVEVPIPVRATQSYVWKVTASDPDDTVLTVSVNFGDGTSTSTIVSASRPSASAVATFPHTFALSGTYTVSITAKDKREAQSTLNYLLVVTEAPRTSFWGGAYQTGALFEGYTLFKLFEITPLPAHRRSGLQDLYHLQLTLGH